MRAWLLTWNPLRIDAAHAGLLAPTPEGEASDWTLGGRRHVEAGDRLYLMRLGPEPDLVTVRGIVAVGTSLARPVQGPHWDYLKLAAGYASWRVPCVWERVQPYGAPLLRQMRLRNAFPGVCFSPQASGMRLPEDVAAWIDAHLPPMP